MNLLCNKPLSHPFVYFQFPSLCISYFRLIAYIGEIYPEKICQLAPHLYKSLLTSVETGLESYPLFSKYEK